MYDEILLPTDGSEGVQSAIDHAIELAGLTDARLHVLYVIDPGAAVAAPESQTMAITNILEEAGEGAVTAAADRAAEAGVEAITVLRHGRAHNQIIDYADEHGIDLIVMGTHGRSGIDRMLLGSVADRVLRRANQPVLVKRIQD